MLNRLENLSVLGTISVYKLATRYFKGCDMKSAHIVSTTTIHQLNGRDQLVFDVK